MQKGYHALKTFKEVACDLSSVNQLISAASVGEIFLLALRANCIM